MKIYIIGSLSQEAQIRMIANFYSSIWHDVKYVKREDDKNFEQLVEECFKNISEADRIIALRKTDGTFGEGVTYELAFARFLKKNITIYNSDLSGRMHYDI